MAPEPILVLASSRKVNGRCVAGLRLDDDGAWVRPISARNDGTLFLEHCAIDGEWPRVFDVVAVELVEPRPTPWHPEDWLIGAGDWELLDRVEPREILDDLVDTVDHDARILEDSNRTVEAQEYRDNPLDRSLVLARPSALSWNIERPPWGMQYKAMFTLGGGWTTYDWLVTDPELEPALHGLGVGRHERSEVGIDDAEDVLLTLSVSEPWVKRDTCSKLVAAAVRMPPAIGG